ncbi:hypothetical protein FACS1894180_0580 [Bacteroidia bacterium]|nr:hypothetical protein FACS1894178_7680 [Bacteroidia bacterium]GHV42928.1 hypothetical protein FACS1894180_0580 [Bacteroidia bacterium]
MKTILKIVTILLILAGSFSCNKDDNILLLKGTKWKLISFVNNAETIAPDPNGQNNFWIKFLPDSTMTGISSTNQMYGNFQIGDNNEIQITIHTITEINELGNGILFVDNLSRVSSFTVTESELKLYYSENEYLLFNLYQL